MFSAGSARANRYRRLRSELAAKEASAAQTRRDQARLVAGAEVLRHGFRLTVEDCSLRSWAKLWGRALHAFAPGLLLSALHREAEAVAGIASKVGGVFRASTRTTALSQRLRRHVSPRDVLLERQEAKAEL